MKRSRRKNCNAVNAASLARWIVMTAFLALAGLSYVYLTLQLYHLGERKKAVENELVSLRTQNDIASAQIAALTSRSALQRRLKEGYLKMVPISEANIVRLTIPPRSRRRHDPTRSESLCRKMNPNSRSRCVLVCTGFIGLFSIFSFRLIYLQAIKHDEYAGLAAEKNVYKQIIHAERGMILDANNEVLAHNIPVETVVADATHFNNRQAIVALVSHELGIPSGEVAEKLDSERRYIVIKREVPAATANALRQKLRAGNLRGIYFEHDATRIYPNGSMLCHVIGFTDFDRHGIQGVEASME